MFIGGIIILATLLIFSITNNTNTNSELPDKIDIFLYDNLGIHPDNYDIITTKEVYSSTEKNNIQISKKRLKENRQNSVIAGLQETDNVNLIYKTITTYGIKRKHGGIEQRTLVEIQFSTKNDVNDLTVLEIIPKTYATADKLLLPDEAMLIEKDPIIAWNLGTIKKNENKILNYVILDDVTPRTTTIFSIPKKQFGNIKIKCGDGKCVQGESYLSCCSDCGCPTGFICNGVTCSAVDNDECKTDSDCDDSILATIDKCDGKPKVCSNFYTTQCENYDLYCPTGCNSTTDNDCIEKVEEITEERNWTVNTKPEIHNILITPPKPSPGDTIKIETKIIDPNGHSDIDLVWGGILELTESFDDVEGTMMDDGLDSSGDSEKDDDIYTINIPINTNVTKGEYTVYVYVRDLTGNEITGRQKINID